MGVREGGQRLGVVRQGRVVRRGKLWESEGGQRLLFASMVVLEVWAGAQVADARLAQQLTLGVVTRDGAEDPEREHHVHGDVEVPVTVVELAVLCTLALELLELFGPNGDVAQDVLHSGAGGRHMVLDQVCRRQHHSVGVLLRLRGWESIEFTDSKYFY